MAQGKFRVDRGAEPPMALPASGGLVFAKRDEAGAMTVAHDDAGPRAVTLEALERRVRAARAAPKKLAPVPPAAPGPRAPAAPSTPTPPPASETDGR